MASSFWLSAQHWLGLLFQFIQLIFMRNNIWQVLQPLLLWIGTAWVVCCMAPVPGLHDSGASYPLIIMASERYLSSGLRLIPWTVLLCRQAHLFHLSSIPFCFSLSDSSTVSMCPSLHPWDGWQGGRGIMCLQCFRQEMTQFNQRCVLS